MAPEPALAPLAGLLLAGGQSRRMGEDKAALRYAGEPQLERAWRLLSAVAAPCRLSLRAGQEAEPLRAAYPQLVDAAGGAGPMAGLIAAHRFLPEHAWLLLACDLPRLTPGTLARLVAARRVGLPAVAFAAAGDGRPEPLCAVYEPAFLAGMLVPAFAAGERSLRRCLEGAGLALLPAPGSDLESIDTPEARARAQAELEGRNPARGQG